VEKSTGAFSLLDGAARERPARRFSGGRSREIDTDGRTVRLFIGAGRQAGIRPGDLVGAITGEAGVESRSLGAIEIADRFSLIEVPDNLADDIITALNRSHIRHVTSVSFVRKILTPRRRCCVGAHQ